MSTICIIGQQTKFSLSHSLVLLNILLCELGGTEHAAQREGVDATRDVAPSKLSKRQISHGKKTEQERKPGHCTGQLCSTSSY